MGFIWVTGWALKLHELLPRYISELETLIDIENSNNIRILADKIYLIMVEDPLKSNPYCGTSNLQIMIQPHDCFIDLQ
jgi:hypothetical protein